MDDIILRITFLLGLSPCALSKTSQKATDAYIVRSQLPSCPQMQLHRAPFLDGTSHKDLGIKEDEVPNRLP